ncbi:hypothetical protein [Actinomadura rubrisoli]|uniref:Uncharacterized protein n=1 Tax=Actinomadura rubrisoli TaxID=2530368 RepID=A0A4V2YYJ2_9ACTN|nr:hypothetical protein [Actinomadura rubrisoli]TDD93327.1 hypothetical protein E1298_10095 [Actinomadura rubrisoli]
MDDLGKHWLWLEPDRRQGGTAMTGPANDEEDRRLLDSAKWDMRTALWFAEREGNLSVLPGCPHREVIGSHLSLLKGEDEGQLDRAVTALAGHPEPICVDHSYVEYNLLSLCVALTRFVENGPSADTRAQLWLAESRIRPPRPRELIMRRPTSGDVVRQAVAAVVEVGPYLGAAAVGGVIGNRADASVVAATTRILRAVRERWRQRTGSVESAPLSQDEAVDAARAVALTQGFTLDHCHVAVAEYNSSSGDWIILLDRVPRDGRVLRVRVPSGDPAQATILIVPRP